MLRENKKDLLNAKNKLLYGRNVVQKVNLKC